MKANADLPMESKNWFDPTPIAVQRIANAMVFGKMDAAHMV